MRLDGTRLRDRIAVIPRWMSPFCALMFIFKNGSRFGLPPCQISESALPACKGSGFSGGMTSEVAMSLGRAIVERFDVGWAAAGFDDKAFDELIEVMLRVVQSPVLDPGRPPRHGTDLRRFLSTWPAPAVRARALAQIGHSAPTR